MIVREGIDGMQEVTTQELEEALKELRDDDISLKSAIENMKRGDTYCLEDGVYSWCKPLDKSMDDLTKASIELAWPLQYAIQSLPKECQDAYEAFQKAYIAEIGKKIPGVAVDVEIPLLDEFKKDIPEFREELEKRVDELGDLLHGFNTKYGEFFKLSVEMDFKVEEV